ncbi:glutamyl-tRNA reductase [Salinibacterium sp. ZJ454]|uniref:glutamyl-tRNA reductase n=1 Tax=Salinibacterium sp. ZJ454 TaxID=2708339 RepID=UPI00142472A3|nr:glutamyl-tRNA reductase [Salinibacterium sp. ZJ454]
MLLCLTASHRTTSFDVLEQLTVGASAVASTLGAHADIAGAVVLSTCNRFEVYLDTDATDAVELIASAAGLDADILRSSATQLHGDSVAQHLFSVSSGLESVVVGEDEISGQVSRALLDARDTGSTSPALEKLFQRATKTSRGVKTQTALGGAGRSLVRLALELVSSRITDWAETRVLLVGTGQYAATTVVALRDRGAEQISVFSPSGRALPFATKHTLSAEVDLALALTAADVVITCTSGAEPVITPEVLTAGARRMIVDLGLPRNVDPLVVGVAGVELLDLETISLHAPLDEITATADARELVGSAASEFVADVAIAPAVVALRTHVLGILDAELARGRAATPEAEAALRHFAGVLLHGPSVRARELALEGRASDVTAALETLFGVQVEAPAAAGEAAEPATA